MKYLKLLMIAVVTAFTFGTSKSEAQVVVRARVGHPVFYHHNGRRWQHRTPYWRHHHRYYRYY